MSGTEMKKQCVCVSTQTHLVWIFTINQHDAKHRLNVCFGNLWFLGCVFAGVILSPLKLGKRQQSVRSEALEIPMH